MELLRTRRRTAVVAVAVVVALLASAVLAPAAWNYAAGPDGTVAVVTLSGSITSQSADAVVEDLRRARTDDSIDAVVLRVDSPGGAVGASESIYLAVRRTADAKPVVANVAGQAASGGYMAVLGADRVVATPSSMLGSVGVYGSVPTVQPGNVDGYVATAPTKGTAGTAEEVRRSIERIKQTFVGLVMDERGANLTVDRQTVSRAKVYTGTRGVELGFADAIGGRGAALESAADRAGLSDYRVVTYGRHASTGSLLGAESVDTTRYFALHGLPDSAAATSLEAVGPNGTAGTANGTGRAFVGGDRP